jgi:hypothetical protein
MWRSSDKSRSQQQIKAIYPRILQMLCAVLIRVIFCSANLLVLLLNVLYRLPVRIAADLHGVRFFPVNCSVQVWITRSSDHALPGDLSSLIPLFLVALPQFCFSERQTLLPACNSRGFLLSLQTNARCSAATLHWPIFRCLTRHFVVSVRTRLLFLHLLHLLLKICVMIYDAVCIGTALYLYTSPFPSAPLR